MWKAVGGETPAGSTIDTIYDNAFCTDSGLDEEVMRYVTIRIGADLCDAEYSLVLRLDALSLEYTEDGGGENTIRERIISISPCRTILRYPDSHAF